MTCCFLESSRTCGVKPSKSAPNRSVHTSERMQGVRPRSHEEWAGSPALHPRTKLLTSEALERPGPRFEMEEIAKRMSSPVRSDTPSR